MRHSLQTYREFLNTSGSFNKIIGDLQEQAWFNCQNLLWTGQHTKCLCQVALLQLVTGTLVNGPKFENDKEFWDYKRKNPLKDFAPHSDKIKEYRDRRGKLNFQRDGLGENGFYLGVRENDIVAEIEQVRIQTKDSGNRFIYIYELVSEWQSQCEKEFAARNQAMALTETR